MNSRAQNGMVVILGFFLLLMVGVVYVQSSQMREQTELMRQVSQQFQNEQAQKPTTTNEQIVKPIVPSVPIANASSTNPLVSPDGKQAIVYRKLGVDTIGQVQTDTITHVFELRSQVDQSVKELFRVVERVNKQEDSPGTNAWTPVGWSNDGTKIYVAESPVPPVGLGGNYPTADAGAKILLEVDARTGERKTVLDLGVLWGLQNGIYLNVTNPGLDRLVYSTLDGAKYTQNLYFSDMGKQHRQTIMTLLSDGAVVKGVSRVEMGADAAKLFVTTFEGDGSNDYTYKRWEYDLSTKTLRAIAS